MTERKTLLSAPQVAAYRRELGLLVDEPTGRVTMSIEGLEALDEFFDRMSGRWALTADERAIRRACRERFGYYDPALSDQAEFVEQWLVDRETKRTMETPKSVQERPQEVLPMAEQPIDELWASYLASTVEDRQPAEESRPQTDDEPWSAYLSTWRGVAA